VQEMKSPFEILSIRILLAARQNVTVTEVTDVLTHHKVDLPPVQPL